MSIAEGTPKINSIGVKFKIDCGEDVSAATIKILSFLYPDGTILNITATVEDNNYFIYTTTADDDGLDNTLLSQAGGWSVSAYGVLADGFVGYGEVLKFTVEGVYQ